MSKLKIQKISEKEGQSLPVFSEFARYRDGIRDRAYSLFSMRDSLNSGALEDWLFAERLAGWPAAELRETGKQFTIRIALAGFAAGDIEVTATPQTIMIRAARKKAQKKAAAKSEVCWTEFRRKVFRYIDLPSEVKVGKLAAEFKRGILTINAPKVRKKASAKPMKTEETGPQQSESADAE